MVLFFLLTNDFIFMFNEVLLVFMLYFLSLSLYIFWNIAHHNTSCAKSLILFLTNNQIPPETNPTTTNPKKNDVRLDLGIKPNNFVGLSIGNAAAYIPARASAMKKTT